MNGWRSFKGETEVVSLKTTSKTLVSLTWMVGQDNGWTGQHQLKNILNQHLKQPILSTQTPQNFNIISLVDVCPVFCRILYFFDTSENAVDPNLDHHLCLFNDFIYQTCLKNTQKHATDIEVITAEFI